ncbi:hypothetical protein EYF80_000442 [Liparis tanakae]|uniref:Uncharacterized protein n=1 Tax=Liparis tanakae TaxID=230148 RepID=A0A4Z2JHD8_9TELE|nr:hypothetical protein EYF80_000442 [Liparis tanakae]
MSATCLLAMRAGCQKEDRSEGCGRVSPGSGGRRLEAGEDGALVVGGVHTSLNTLLKHRRGPARPKVVRELLDPPLVQKGPHLAVLV